MTKALMQVTALFILFAGPAAAQVPVFVNGSIGGSYDIDDRDPLTGGGFAYLVGVGLRFRQLAVGAEFGQQSLGGGRKAKQYGAVARFSAGSSGPVRPYFVVGVSDYRYSPAANGNRSAVGGSVGPGVAFALASWRVSALLEARFHSSFDRIAAVSSQEFLSVMVGLQFGL